MLGEVALLQALASNSLWTTISIKPLYRDNVMSRKSMGEENCFFMGCSGHVRPGTCSVNHLKGAGWLP